MNRNLISILYLLVAIVGLSSCSLAPSEPTPQKKQLSAEEKQRWNTCRSLHPKAKAMIEEKSGYAVTLLDPKNFQQGQPLDQWFYISANIDGQFANDCPQKMEDVKIVYGLQQGPDLQFGYHFKFVEAEGIWDRLEEGVNVNAAAIRTPFDEPPQLTMTIDSLPVDVVYPQRIVSDDNVAVTVHQSIHAHRPEVTYTVSNVGNNFVTVKGISITSGNFVVDEIYRRPQTLPPRKEFRELKLKSPNRLPGLGMTIRSPEELDQGYKIIISVPYEINGVGHTMIKEFTLPLRDIVKRR